MHFLSHDCHSLRRNPARRVITNNISVCFPVMSVTCSSLAFCCFNVLNRVWKQASRSATAQCLKPTPLICLRTEPFQFIKLQNSYIVQPNNRQRSKRKPLSLHTSTLVMTLWIELSLECTRHQNTGPPRKKCIRDLRVELDVK